MEKLVIRSEFWQAKKVLVTGHTGFKGGWLAIWLQSLGAEVIGIALEPDSEPNLFQQADVEQGMTSIIGDIRNLDFVKKTIDHYQPEIVFHLAAQALVRESYLDPVETYQTNVMGTMNVLEAIRHCNSVQAAVMVTTDKCYDNKEWQWPYRENDRLGGHDPYSSSKACTELMIDSYRRSFFASSDSAAIASARAGNVIGGGDWAKDRLIPDILSAYNSRQDLKIRYPEAIRPWQHVLEPLHGYLILAEKLFSADGHDYAQAWNFGPAHDSVKPVSWIADYFAHHWPEFNWQLDGNEQLYEAGILKLDCSKAHKQLGWQPHWNLEQALDYIMAWTERFDEQHNMKQVCLEQIANYIQEIK